MEDWQDFVKHLIERDAPKVVIIINMNDVIKTWNNSASRRSDDEGENDDEEAASKTSMSDLDWELACIRLILEAKWVNHHTVNADSNSYTYIPSDGSACYSLTPFLMKEWCRAIYDGQTTM
ncbi:hypothetical protein SCP_1004320 [Sparassis crispa]|uniref:Uncharacterized protein n=1 Tax=Sparassis crispa TaxID=139825 RepID=A0A401GY78_9APHY|nr:hypothetical protein SCP_1004320 [Sparassis crispa]GBE87185.1 hypothetical protein SCP_1004320 [Sparassis crispa]